MYVFIFNCVYLTEIIFGVFFESMKYVRKPQNYPQSNPDLELILQKKNFQVKLVYPTIGFSENYLNSLMFSNIFTKGHKPSSLWRMRVLSPFRWAHILVIISGQEGVLSRNECTLFIYLCGLGQWIWPVCTHLSNSSL